MVLYLLLCIRTVPTVMCASLGKGWHSQAV